MSWNRSKCFILLVTYSMIVRCHSPRTVIHDTRTNVTSKINSGADGLQVGRQSAKQPKVRMVARRIDSMARHSWQMSPRPPVSQGYGRRCPNDKRPSRRRRAAGRGRGVPGSADEDKGSSGRDISPYWASASNMGVERGGGGGGDASPPVKNLRGDVPSRFEDEVAQIRFSDF